LCFSEQGVSWLLDRKRRTHFLPPHSLHLIPLDFFFWGFVKDIVYCEKYKMWKRCITEFTELQIVIMKCLPIPGKRLIIISMCAVPLTVPILRSTVHTRNFARSSVWKCIYFSNMLYGWNCVLFCHFRLETCNMILILILQWRLVHQLYFLFIHYAILFSF
jgi:hypothetical protein